MKKHKVLIVDDSAIVRDLLTKQLKAYPDITIVGSAPDAYAARRYIVKYHPDVITLDIEMPKMDGLTFLKYLMKSYPLPVIIVSSLLEGQNRLAMEALELGAVDLVPKPGGPFSVGEIIEELAAKIRTASKINFESLRNITIPLKKPSVSIENSSAVFSRYKATKKIVAVGASTGGTIALEYLFKQLSPDMPPIPTVIHMPQGFTKTFAQRLDELCKITVKEAEDGEKLINGIVYIAPGNRHMKIKTRGTDLIIQLDSGAKVHNCRPAVDILFNSLAESIGRNTCAVLLTGMGKDGAAGMKNIQSKGGYTIAQDEKSCIVFGMPKAAIDAGAADSIKPLDKIHEDIERNFLSD